MNDYTQRELRRRLEALAPLFHNLGTRVVQTYSDSGILEAVAGDSFPVSDALFTHRHGRFVYHPHGPVYFYVTRAGDLQLAGQRSGESLASALLGYVHLARPGELEKPFTVEAATEWFPPPRFALDTATSGLQIAAVSATRECLWRTTWMSVRISSSPLSGTPGDTGFG
jgi:hypothetical protein